MDILLLSVFGVYFTVFDDAFSNRCKECDIKSLPTM